MKKTVSLVPSTLSTPELHRYLLGAVGPRPIAFASTINETGIPNLSPFSFFNVFSANPPVLIFSPARRVRDNTTKHTLENVKTIAEVVINIVNYEIVQQMSLSSTEYPLGVNEFVKAGLTMQPSDLIRPFRVAEAPVQFECEVTKVEPLGDEGGAGNLIFSRVVKIHIHEEILDARGNIDQEKIDQVARMGGNWYTRAKIGMFEVPKPLSTQGIGVDQIPPEIRSSSVLTGNDLGLLGNIEQLPKSEEVDDFIASSSEARAILSGGDQETLHRKAQDYLRQGEPSTAWKLLLAGVKG